MRTRHPNDVPINKLSSKSSSIDTPTVGYGSPVINKAIEAPQHTETYNSFTPHRYLRRQTISRYISSRLDNPLTSEISASMKRKLALGGSMRLDRDKASLASLLHRDTAKS